MQSQILSYESGGTLGDGPDASLDSAHEDVEREDTMNASSDGD